MMKPAVDKIPLYECPICHNHIRYSNIYNYRRSVKNHSCCKDCNFKAFNELGLKTRFGKGHSPHNKGEPVPLYYCPSCGEATRYQRMCVYDTAVKDQRNCSKCGNRSYYEPLILTHRETDPDIIRSDMQWHFRCFNVHLLEPDEERENPIDYFASVPPYDELPDFIKDLCIYLEDRLSDFKGIEQRIILKAIDLIELSQFEDYSQVDVIELLMKECKASREEVLRTADKFRKHYIEFLKT